MSSYFLGDSVKQFSIIIGFYLASMGFGSWLSRFFKKNILFSFIWIEVILGIIGAFSIPLCYFYFSFSDVYGFNIFILGLISIIGSLTGLEVPLLTALLQNEADVKEKLSDILTLDYLGALVATLLFPFILIPFMGVYKSSLLFGFLNIAIGFSNFILFKDQIQSNRKKDTILWTIMIAFISLIILAGVRADAYINFWNSSIFKHPVIYNSASPYQNIVLTNNGEEFRLYLNSAVQFSSKDEYRYHEALVHVPAMQIPDIKDVVILGGGEGLAARELLKYKSIESIYIIELDPEISKISKEIALLKDLNQNALDDEKVTIVNEDAFVWLMKNSKKFDLIIADLPDPNNEGLSRLYSISMYHLIQNSLQPTGIFVTQATSPELSPDAFWCVNTTLSKSGFKYTYPYHINVPSFGNWGFIAARNDAIDFQFNDDLDLRFIEEESFRHLFYFPPDVNDREVEANRLDRPIIMKYYLDHWKQLNAEKK